MKLDLNVKTTKFSYILNNGEKLEIYLNKPSYQYYLELIKNMENEKDASIIALQALPKLIKDWNIHDDDGNKYPINKETVEAFLSLALTQLKDKEGTPIFARIVEDFANMLNGNF